MAHRTVFKKLKADYLEDEYDQDLEDLRWERYLLLKEKEENARQKAAGKRWRFYFYIDGTCREHDRSGCCECRNWANGVCPSYWEEFRLR
jgi:hypothetical protein